MVDSSDMSTPVTRGELREEIERVEIRLERVEIRLDRLDQKVAQMATVMATKADLEIWGGALLARIESGQQRMLAELARHAKAIQEAMSTQISAIDEKYADLPARVSRLETAVFVPERR
jgi:chromosome segregation ATPase